MIAQLGVWDLPGDHALFLGSPIPSHQDYSHIPANRIQPIGYARVLPRQHGAKLPITVQHSLVPADTGLVVGWIGRFPPPGAQWNTPVGRHRVLGLDDQGLVMARVLDSLPRLRLQVRAPGVT